VGGHGILCPPAKTVGGHVPCVPHQIAPMHVRTPGWENWYTVGRYLADGRPSRRVEEDKAQHAEAEQKQCKNLLAAAIHKNKRNTAGYNIKVVRP